MQKISIIGSLGKQAEQKQISGKNYVIFSLAESRNREDETTWYNILYRTDRGDNLVPWLKKGSQVYVEGRLSAKIYAKNDGTSAIDMTVFVNDLQLCGKREENAAPAAPAYQAPAAPAAPASTPLEVNTPAGQAESAEEDLPF